MANYKNVLIQIILMAHICENDMIQIKDMFQIVAKWLQFSTEEYAFELSISLGDGDKSVVLKAKCMKLFFIHYWSLLNYIEERLVLPYVFRF